MAKKICANCRFMVPHALGEYGWCHFWPIQAVAPDSGTWVPVCIKDTVIKKDDRDIPVYADDSWCAYFRPARRWWQFWRRSAA